MYDRECTCRTATGCPPLRPVRRAHRGVRGPRDRDGASRVPRAAERGHPHPRRAACGARAETETAVCGARTPGGGAARAPRDGPSPTSRTRTRPEIGDARCEMRHHAAVASAFHWLCWESYTYSEHDTDLIMSRRLRLSPISLRHAPPGAWTWAWDYMNMCIC